MLSPMVAPNEKDELQRKLASILVFEKVIKVRKTKPTLLDNRDKQAKLQDILTDDFFMTRKARQSGCMIIKSACPSI